MNRNSVVYTTYSLVLRFSYPPFYDENPFGIYEKILAAKVHYPSALDAVAKDLIKKLLVVDRTKRYGCMKNGAEDVKEHKFFKDFDWDHLMQRRISAPYVPIVHHNGDTANFGEFDEESVGNLPAQYVPKPPTGPVDMKQLFANF
jgi:serine/threonine protein kinase